MCRHTHTHSAVDIERARHEHPHVIKATQALPRGAQKCGYIMYTIISYRLWVWYDRSIDNIPSLPGIHSTRVEILRSLECCSTPLLVEKED